MEWTQVDTNEESSLEEKYWPKRWVNETVFRKTIPSLNCDDGSIIMLSHILDCTINTKGSFDSIYEMFSEVINQPENNVSTNCH